MKHGLFRILPFVALALAACDDDDPRISHFGYPSYGVAVSGDHIIGVANNDLAVRFFGVGATGSVDVGGTPVHIAFDPTGAVAYATLQSSNTLVRLTVDPSDEATRVDYGHPLYNLAVSPSGNAVYVTTATGWLFRADPTTLAKLDSVKLASNSNGIAFAPNGTTLYVSTIVAGYLYEITAATLAKTDSFDVGTGAQRVAVSPGGDSVYVANEGSVSLKVVRPSTGAVTSRSIAGTPYGVALSADGERLFVTLRTAGEVVALDRATLKIVETWNIGGIPRNIATSPDGEVVVVSTQSDLVQIQSFPGW